MWGQIRSQEAWQAARRKTGGQWQCWGRQQRVLARQGRGHWIWVVCWEGRGGRLVKRQLPVSIFKAIFS